MVAWEPEFGGVFDFERKPRQAGLMLVAFKLPRANTVLPVLSYPLTCSNTESPSQSLPRTLGAWTRT